MSVYKLCFCAPSFSGNAGVTVIEDDNIKYFGTMSGLWWSGVPTEYTLVSGTTTPIFNHYIKFDSGANPTLCYYSLDGISPIYTFEVVLDARGKSIPLASTAYDNAGSYYNCARGENLTSHLEGSTYKDPIDGKSYSYVFWGQEGVSTTSYKITVNSSDVNNNQYEDAYDRSARTLRLMRSDDSVTWTECSGVLWSWYATSSDLTPAGTATTSVINFTDACTYARITASVDNGGSIAAEISFIINPLQLTASNTTVATTKVYDGDSSAQINNIGSLSGVLTGDFVELSGDAYYGTNTSPSAETSSVGENLRVNVVYGLTGSDAINYLAPADYSVSGCSITPLQLEVTGSSVADKTYDGSDSATVTLGTLSNKIATDIVLVAASGQFTDANVALSGGVVRDKDVTVTYTITGGGSRNNYTAPSSETLQAKINPRPITIHDITLS